MYFIVVCDSFGISFDWCVKDIVRLEKEKKNESV